MSENNTDDAIIKLVDELERLAGLYVDEVREHLAAQSRIAELEAGK